MQPRSPRSCRVDRPPRCPVTLSVSAKGTSLFADGVRRLLPASPGNREHRELLTDLAQRRTNIASATQQNRHPPSGFNPVVGMERRRFICRTNPRGREGSVLMRWSAASSGNESDDPGYPGGPPAEHRVPDVPASCQPTDACFPAVTLLRSGEFGPGARRTPPRSILDGEAPIGARANGRTVNG